MTTALAPSAAPASPLRKLLTPFVEPETFDFWARKVHPTWSWSRALAQVVERREEARDTVTLLLAPNAHVGEVRPGQHINVSAEVAGRRVTRSYSITNVPGEDRRLAITVKRVEGGKLSDHLVRHAKVGDVMELGPAFGDMTWPLQPLNVAPQWLFLAAGSGITPLMSLTRAWAARRMAFPVTLVYWARTRADAAFANELNELARQRPQFQFHLILTHEAGADQPAQGEISAQRLAELAPDLDRSQVFACGPGGFVAAARQLCEGRSHGFLAEGFTAAPLADDTPITTVKVELRRTGKTLEVSTGTSLLEALEAQGVNPRSGCRMGICHTCSCTRLSGTTTNMQTGDTEDEPASALRICVNRARTDLSLDL